MKFNFGLQGTRKIKSRTFTAWMLRALGAEECHKHTLEQHRAAPKHCNKEQRCTDNRPEVLKLGSGSAGRAQRHQSLQGSQCPCSAHGNSPRDAGKQKKSRTVSRIVNFFLFKPLDKPRCLLHHCCHLYLDCSNVPGDSTWSQLCTESLLSSAPCCLWHLLTLHIMFYQLWCYKFTCFLAWSGIYWSLRSTVQLKLSWLHILSQIHSVNDRRVCATARKGSKCTAVHQARKSKSKWIFSRKLQGSNFPCGSLPLEEIIQWVPLE